MVTHGFVTFKYEDIYYIFYNHSDSYFSYLGKKVVNEINDIIYNITKGFEYYKKKLLRIPLLDKINNGDNYFNSIHDSICYFNIFSYYTSENEPSNEYNYIIDFDEDEFIITTYNNRYIFDLFDIPHNWMEITEDNNYYEYENKEEKQNNKIKEKILELEEEINKLKMKLN